MADPDNVRAEFAIIVRSDLKGQGLGPVLLQKLVDYLRARGIREIVGDALADNRRIVGLVKRFGFEVRHSGEPGTMSLRLRLEPD